MNHAATPEQQARAMKREEVAAPIRVALGGRIKARRLALRMSLERLAEVVGVGPTMMSQYEHGAGRMAVITLAQVCHVLETTPNRLLGYPEDQPPKGDA